MDISKLTEYAGRLTATLLLIFIVYSGSMGLWVYGTTYKQMVAERDEWKDLAIKGAVIANKTTFAPFGAAGPKTAVAPRTAAEVAEQLRTAEERHGVKF